MPPSRIHAAQARHNHAFWGSLDLAMTPFRDWAVTAMFYECLHWLEAYLATQGVHPTSHSERRDSLSYFPDLDRIGADYAILKYESENSRYNGYVHSREEAAGLARLVANVEAAVAPFV